jgi:hypothetical protein
MNKTQLFCFENKALILSKGSISTQDFQKVFSNPLHFDQLSFSGEVLYVKQGDL